MWERWGVGEGRKSRRKREGGKALGIGEWWVRGKGKIAKSGKRAWWEMLAGEDNPEKDGKY